MASTNGEEKEVKSLVGCILKMDALKAGMFIDPSNVKDGQPLTLAFFEGSKSEFTFEEGMNDKIIRRSVEHGILRAFKGKKDVTVEYGGPPMINWKRKPLVSVPKPKDEIKDKALLDLLKSNDEGAIVAQIIAMDSYSVLERLYELEKAGENPTFRSRSAVIDCIEKRKKEVPSGITTVKKDIKEKAETITIT